MFALLVCFSLLAVCTTGSMNSCNYCTSMNFTTDCRCDEDCYVYTDCCSDSGHDNQTQPLNSSLNLILQLPAGVELKCISNRIHQDGIAVGYFMVSSCPNHWVDQSSESVREKCSSSDVEFLLPVIDTNTGLVYRNEHCSRCNGVSQILAWDVILICTDEFRDSFTRENISKLLLTNVTILQNECKIDFFMYPLLATFTLQDKIKPRTCTITEQKCPPYSPQCAVPRSQYEELVEECQSGDFDPVVGIINNDTLYRNSACAECNMQTYQCIDLTTAEPRNLVFITTLNNLERRHVPLLPGIISLSCPEGEVVVGLNCRPTDCPSGYTLFGGACNYTSVNFTSCPHNITLSNSSYVQLGNGSVLLKSDSSIVEVLEYNDLGLPIVCKTLNCSTGLVALNASEYELLENGSIIFQNTLLEVHYYDAINRVLICPNLISSSSSVNSTQPPSFLPSLPGIQELTYAGCSLSVIGALLVLLTYSLFSELRTYPGLILMNLCGAILSTSLIFILARPILSLYFAKEVCSTLAILLHYNYLSQFTWMSIFSFEIMRTFYLSRKLAPVSKESKRKLFFLYLFMAWVIPLVIVSVSLILNYSTNNLILYGVNVQGQISYCWINQRESFIVVFLVPLVLCLSANVVIFVITSVFLCLECRRQSNIGKSNNSGIMRVWIAAFFITGLTWIFGFVALVGGRWVWYLFIIFNSTQGLVISVVFIFTNKVFQLYRDKFRLRKKTEGSTVGTSM